MKSKVDSENILENSVKKHQIQDQENPELKDNYYNFFDHVPVAVWVEDFSKIKEFVTKAALDNNTSTKLYLKNNEEVISSLASLVVIKDVNSAAVELYEAKDKIHLLGNLNKVLTEESVKGFTNLVMDALLGKKETSVETKNITLKGKEFDALIKFKVFEGSEESLDKIIVSIQDITDVVKSRKDLFESEKRYKEAHEIAKLSSWYFDFKTNKVYWSSEAYNLVDIEPQDENLNLEFYLSFVHELDRDYVNKFSIDYLLSNPTQNLQYRIITSKGEVKHILEKRSVLIENNRILKITGICQDITESVQFELKHKTTKKLFSNTLSSIKDGFVILDYNSNYLFINEEASKLLNIKNPEELIGQNMWEEFPENEGDTFFDNYHEALKSRKPISFENYFEPWNRWFKNRIIPSSEGMLLFFNEITDKKISENKIKKAYNIINKSPSIAMLCRNEMDFPFDFVSENVFDLFGYTSSDFLLNKVKLFDLAHPEDIEYIRTEFFKLTNKKDDSTFRPRPFRIISKGGKVKWIRSSIDVLKNDQGAITHIQGVAEDITKQKRNEDLVFKSNQRLKDQFSNSPLASIMWDVNYKVLEWNTSAERIFGYTAEEVIGTSIKDLLTPSHLLSQMKILRETLFKRSTSIKNTNENITKNGKIITCDWYSVSLKDSENNYIGTACFVDDITDRKETEISLFNTNQRLQNQFNNTPLASIVWDLDMRVLEWNNAAHKIFGYSPKEAIGELANDIIIPTEIQTEIIEVGNNLIDEKGGKRSTNINKRKNGDIITCDWYNVALKDVTGKVIGMASLVDDITERINNKKIIEKSEKKYRDIFDKSIDAVMILKEGLVVDCNRSTLSMFGYDNKQALLKTHPSKISPETQTGGQSSFIKSQRMIKIALEMGSNRFRWDHKRKDGFVFPAEVSLTRIDESDNKPTIHAVVKDITERVKNEALEDVLYNISKAALTIDNFKEFSLFLKNELHKIIDTQNFFIALYDEKTGLIKTPIFVDEKEEILEFPIKNSLTGYVIKTNKSLMANEEDLLSLIETKEVELMGELPKIWIGVPLRDKNKVVGAIVVQNYNNENSYTENDVQLLEFVSDQISTTIQRKKVEDELKEALLKAQESDKLKSSFLANMSHEIRTPMNGIIGFSELFLGTDLTDKDRKKYANVVIKSSKQLLTIVNDILDISKIEAGVVKLNYETVNLNKLLNDLNSFYKPRAIENNLELRCVKGLEKEESNIKIDIGKLNQVLTNLLSNAFKFTDEGSIEFGYLLRNKNLQFYVKDTGVGIEENLQNKIFDRFIQANLDLSKKLQGTGLGLSISKKFVELFGGEIWLNSNSEGSTVYFSIPYNKSKSVEIKPVIKQTKPKIQVENQKLTILVAEDEEYNMMYINELFSKTSFNIIEAENGKMAINLAKENPNINLILMDIKMPIMDGNEAMAQIKKDKPALPIIALSAFAMESDKKSALSKGFDAYLTKPIDKKLLFEMIGKFAK